MTPEARVKAKVKKILKKYQLYSNWPVPCGYGWSTLDCFGFINGLGFAIETKAPGNKPTKLQEKIIEQMQLAGAKVFVIDGDTSELESWLNAVHVTRKTT